MTKQVWLLGGILFAAFLAFAANYGTKISDAYGETTKLQFQLDATNARVDMLEKRIKELEEDREIDQQRMGEIEARNSN